MALMVRIDSREIDVAHDICIDHQHGGVVPKIGHVSDTTAGPQDFRFVARHDRKCICLLCHIRFDLHVVIVCIDNRTVTAGLLQTLDNNVQQWSPVDGKQWLRRVPTVGSKPRPESGGKNHCFHV